MARGPSLVQAVPIAPELQREAHVGQEVAIPGSDGFAEAGNAIGRELAGVSKTLGRLADHAAQVEGQRAGHLAGMDPEFRPTHLMTIRAEAFDKAGLQTALSRLHVGIVNDVEDAHQKHIANPAELKKVLDAKRAGYLKQAPLDLQPEIATLFEKTSAAAFRSATRELWARQQADLQGATVAELQTITRRMQQEAFGLGLDQPAEDILNSRFAELKGVLARKGINGQPLIPPATAAKMLEQAKEELTTSRVMGTFGRLPSPDAKAQFLAKLEEEFAKSEGLAKNYDIATFRQVTSALQADLNRDLALRRTQENEIQKQLQRYQQMALAGDEPPAAEREAFRARLALEAPQALPALDILDRVRKQSQSWIAGTPEQMDLVVRRLQEDIRTQGVTDERQTLLKTAEGVRTAMRAGIKEDPYGWAEKARVIPKLAEIDWGKPETIVARAAQRETLGAYYGIKAPMLRPDERRRLEAGLAEGGERSVAIAAAIAKVAPEHVGQILGELDKQHAGHLAQLGLIVANKGDPGFVEMAANGLALSRLPAKDRPQPVKVNTRDVEAAMYGLVENNLPPSAARAAVERLALEAYQVQAQRERLTGFDTRKFQTLVRQALGERSIEGVTYGGVVNAQSGVWNGSNPVIIPMNIRQDRFRALLDAIRPEDLADGMGSGPKHGDGRPATAAEIRGARLVQADTTGRYYLSTGRNRYLTDGQNERFVLDLGRLEPELRRRKPDAYLGAGR